MTKTQDASVEVEHKNGLEVFDTSAIADKGKKLELLDPNGEVITHNNEVVSITLIGSDGARFEKIRRNRLLKIERSKKQNKDKDLHDAYCAILADCTISWSNVFENGKSLECKFENAKYLYKKYTFIFEQALEFVGDRTNFLPSK